MTVLASPTAQASTQSHDLDHVYCCDPDIALCGADLSSIPETGDEDPDCIVCLDLEFAVCPRCGDNGD